MRFWRRITGVTMFGCCPKWRCRRCTTTHIDKMAICKGDGYNFVQHKSKTSILRVGVERPLALLRMLQLQPIHRWHQIRLFFIGDTQYASEVPQGAAARAAFGESALKMSLKQLQRCFATLTRRRKLLEPTVRAQTCRIWTGRQQSPHIDKGTRHTSVGQGI